MWARSLSLEIHLSSEAPAAWSWHVFPSFPPHQSGNAWALASLRRWTLSFDFGPSSSEITLTKRCMRSSSSCLWRMPKKATGERDWGGALAGAWQVVRGPWWVCFQNCTWRSLVYILHILYLKYFEWAMYSHGSEFREFKDYIVRSLLTTFSCHLFQFPRVNQYC